MNAPFGNGKWQELDLPEVTAAQLLDHLGVLFPGLQEHMRPSVQETEYQMLLVRERQLLSGEDRVRTDDRINVILPLSGG